MKELKTNGLHEYSVRITITEDEFQQLKRIARKNNLSQKQLIKIIILKELAQVRALETAIHTR